MGGLPRVELIEGAFYWVAPAYGKKAGLWVAARWSVGSFWADRSEIPPGVIAGPIPTPDNLTPQEGPKP